jgi:Ca2+-binding EF-hand superfamily protein
MRIVLLCTALSLLTATSAVAQFAKPLPPVGNDKNADPAKPADNAGAQPAGSAVNKLFAALDLDGDGVISKTELKKAIVSLKKLDTNNDGELSMAECGIATDANGKPVADANAANPNGVANDPNANAAGLNGAGNQAFNGRGNEAMGLFLQLDKNHDGKLTRDEVPQQMMPMLSHADLNGDGAIDAQEFAVAAKKMGDRMKAGYAAGMNAGNTNGARRP